MQQEKQRQKEEAKAVKEKKKEEARKIKEEQQRERREKKEKEERERREKKEKDEKEKAERLKAKEELKKSKLEWVLLKTFVTINIFEWTKWVFWSHIRAKQEEKRKKEEEKRMKEEEKRLKEEKDVSQLSRASFLDGNQVTPFFFFFLQRLKAEKAEITRFLQKSKIQQAPKVSVGSRFKYLF